MTRRRAPTVVALLVVALATACGGSSASTGTPAPTASGPVASVEVTLSATSAFVGTSVQATATLRDASGTILSGRTITWSSSDSGIAVACSSAGAACTVQGAAVGTATITAASEGKSGGATVRVKVLGRVDVTAPTTRLAPGQAIQLIARPYDDTGRYVSGATMSWSSDATGVAVVSSAGVVTGVDLGGVRITATATVAGVAGSASGGVDLTVSSSGPPVGLVDLSAASQTGAPYSTAPQAPAVRVVDSTGVGVANVGVTFTVLAGGGTLAAATIANLTTGADGIARSPTWTFGPAGDQRVQATTTELPSASVDFVGLARDPGAAFDVTLRLRPGMTDSQARAFVDAKERIEQVIRGDVPQVSVSFSAGQLQGCGGMAIQGPIDDVVITAQVTAIDGQYGILGQAGPCYLRDGSFLPYVGTMEFDSADLAWMETDGILPAVILHEMMHVVGFGTIWSNLGVLDRSLATDPFFVGVNARAHFLADNAGGLFAGNRVPVEATGGSGTAFAHWRESVLHKELMTGWVDPVSNPLSATTVGSLADLGYSVDYTAADPYQYAPVQAPAATTVRVGGGPVLAEPVDLGGDVRPEPPVVTDLQGRPVR